MQPKRWKPKCGRQPCQGRRCGLTNNNGGNSTEHLTSIDTDSVGRGNLGCRLTRGCRVVRFGGRPQG